MYYLKTFLLSPAYFHSNPNRKPLTEYILKQQ